MSTLPKFAAVIANDKLIMRQGDWRWTREASMLAPTLKMYRDLMNRKNGTYARFYKGAVAVLERLTAAQAGGR